MPGIPRGRPSTADSARTGLLYVAIATALFSTSPVFIRWAAPLSPLEITFWRMVIAAVTVAIMARMRGERIALDWADLPRFAVFGLVAALHFALYIASLSFTTVAHSLSLVYTAPAFVTVLSALLLRETIPVRKYGGIAVVMIGVAVLTGFEPSWSEGMAVGDLMAVGSAICFGFYSVIGRAQRWRYSLLTYATGAYGMAALWLLPVAALTWTGAYGLASVLSLLALGVFPLGIGHTLYNAALRRLHPTYVNLIATQEVTGGVILGLLLLREVPSLNAIVGAAITLLGIGLVLV